MTSIARPQPGGTYNLAERVFGGAPARAARTPGPEPREPEFNLAARVYGERRRRVPIAALEAGDAAAGVLRLAPAPAVPLVGAGSRGGGTRKIRTFESFSSAPFRWYFVSMLGVFGAMNSQMIAKGVLTYDLTGSFAALGTLALANAIPGMALSLHGGVLADRMPKKLIQQVGNTLNALNTLSIVLILLAGVMRWEYMIVNAAIQGIIQALMMPARQSMIPDIVYPRQVMNAVALNNAGMNISRLMVPAGVGFLMEVAPYYWAFALITFFYVFSAVTLIRVPNRPINVPPEEQVAFQPSGRPTFRGHAAPRGAKGAALGDLVDGVKYLFRDRTILTILAVNMMMVMFSMPYMQMLPGFVKEVLHGGPGLQGLLTSVTGIGSLAAALVIASLPSKRRGTIFIAGSVVLGIALIAFSASSSVMITLPVMLFIGVGQSVRMALSNVLVQAYTDDQYRGRVMSIYMMEMSIVQVGVFAVGFASDIIGVQWALGLCSVALVALSLATFALVPRMRNLD